MFAQRQPRRNFSCHSAALKFVIKHVNSIGKYFHLSLSFVVDFFQFIMSKKVFVVRLLARRKLIDNERSTSFAKGFVIVGTKGAILFEAEEV